MCDDNKVSCAFIKRADGQTECYPICHLCSFEIKISHNGSEQKAIIKKESTKIKEVVQKPKRNTAIVCQKKLRSLCNSDNNLNLDQ